MHLKLKELYQNTQYYNEILIQYITKNFRISPKIQYKNKNYNI